MKISKSKYLFKRSKPKTLKNIWTSFSLTQTFQNWQTAKTEYVNTGSGAQGLVKKKICLHKLNLYASAFGIYASKFEIYVSLKFTHVIMESGLWRRNFWFWGGNQDFVHFTYGNQGFHSIYAPFLCGIRSKISYRNCHCCTVTTVCMYS